MAKLPTVFVHSLNDPTYRVRINQADFDPNLHTIWSGDHANERQKVRQKTQEETTEGQQVAEFDQADLETITPDVQDARAYREIELMGIYEQDGWRGLKAIAEPLGIEKPVDGWDESIPLILEAEGYAAN